MCNKSMVNTAKPTKRAVNYGSVRLHVLYYEMCDKIVLGPKARPLFLQQIPPSLMFTLRAKYWSCLLLLSAFSRSRHCERMPNFTVHSCLMPGLIKSSFFCNTRRMKLMFFDSPHDSIVH